MRRTLGSLTMRGRAFLASGITATISGLVLLERDLVRVGLLVAALPLVAAFVVAGRSHHLKVVRQVEPQHLTVGEEATVTVSLQNSGAPTGVLLLEEQLSWALGPRPRFVLPPMGREDKERLAYGVRPETRGRHLIGPLQVRRREPFGMVEMRQEVSGDVTLLALPPVTPLLPLRAGGGFHSSGDDSPRSFSVGKVADVVVREYRRGDDLRRVHWRSTARMGELMVRNEEQTWQARSVVLLDNRLSSHRGSGAGSSLEAAVGAAASVAVHLSSQGFEVRLVTASGTVDAWRERGRSLDPFPILEHLATLDLVDTEHLPEVSVGDEQLGAVAVGVLGSSSNDDARWWGRFPQHGAQCVAFVLDVDAWGQRGTDPADGSPVPTWLTGQGWRAAGLTQGASLAATWRELDR